MDNRELLKRVKQMNKEVIYHRRRIHQFAEIGGEEYKTSQYICREIEKIGLEYRKVGETGVIAALKTGRQAVHIALRADIDALPMKENAMNLKEVKTCISEQENTCHACGHDAHTAMLLGSMAILNEMKEFLCGEIYFCFEAGEENNVGIADMMDALRSEKIDTCWAIHVSPIMETGKMAISSGACMAGAARISIVVRGKGGHGSRPDLSINPVFAAANIAANLPGTFMNQLDAEKTVTHSVTYIHGGDSRNTIPEYAVIKGTIRFFDEEAGRYAVEILKNTALHTAAMHKCNVEFEDTKYILSPLINDKKCAERAKKEMEDLFGQDCVINHAPLSYGSETFSQFCSKYPGVMMKLGIKNEEKGCGASLHNEYFDLDEDALEYGVAATVKYVFSLLQIEEK